LLLLSNQLVAGIVEQQLTGHATHAGLLAFSAELTWLVLLLLLPLLPQELLCSDATHGMLVDVGMPVIQRGEGKGVQRLAYSRTG
jgi:hypothetical protein